MELFQSDETAVARAAKRIDGRGLAARINAETALRAAAATEAGRTPHLAAVMAGDDPHGPRAFAIKAKAAAAAGIRFTAHVIDANAGAGAMIQCIERLNADPGVTGIFVQLPLPAPWDHRAILATLDPTRDVDGYHPVNLGNLAIGHGGFAPCAPLGAIALLKHRLGSLSGLHAVVLGDCAYLGRPMAHLLIQEDCTVTLAPARGIALPQLAAQADMLVTALGRPGLVTADWIKPGATVIDLARDVSLDSVMEKAAGVTPPIGAIGPMTVAMLLAATVDGLK